MVAQEWWRSPLAIVRDESVRVRADRQMPIKPLSSSVSGKNKELSRATKQQSPFRWWLFERSRPSSPDAANLFWQMPPARDAARAKICNWINGVQDRFGGKMKYGNSHRCQSFGKRETGQSIGLCLPM
ncbi:MAG: hypothetical protein JGK17_02785 [Microcoleus sp. PH2017_10_PVI_O_A]|uniref:hypothetical protein n=1 Tax=unclassified Microcoleus TaxID=2642155 RepID=UPI001DE59B1E|nr:MULTISPECIES: hypothetical protein [unclassified Microcoleus]MCC3559158.1 hypothetical protein [Microcoleus sp. PH2017_27_LUM_O_A]TAE83462.1 MAG: hypothetical protein EAZ83_09190 [Oscillatoriales cyanobacterium]MCC3404512.1 hypothetical protein [Microcoleus sp. PH2017_10_PVI_O_A]MCC3458580.1 hypothetical protein [Microcoleus sp. PH2017_11_PCY_U_A]MCC3476830.1 hypothetical protein [Microcoleus sp. PH2017_12_PCY_D_A]